MYYVDYLGPPDLFEQLREPLRRDLAAVVRTDPAGVRIRRLASDPPYSEIELWVELSTEEQLIRLSRDIASRLSATARAASDLDVWVMFRIVPLSQAFLNGSPRGRARS
jgi:hypothetical protein